MPNASDRLPPDQSERDRIVNDLDVNMMVVAGAGAGKTHALIERMVSVIRHDKDTVDHMAAITFTRKAAGEMKQRFHQRLAEAAAESEGAEKERLEEAKASVDRCFIGTIHAFCSRLIRSRPIEAGVPIDFREIDEHEEPGLQRRAWDTFLVDRIAADDETLLDLEIRGVEVEDLYDFFRRRVQFAELPLNWTGTERPDLSEATAAALEFVSDVYPLIPEIPPKGRKDDCMKVVEYAHAFATFHGIESEADQARFLTIVARPKRVILNRWTLSSDSARTLRDKKVPEVDAAVQSALNNWRAYLYRFVARFIDDAQEFYQRLRLSEGLLTFHDLLMRTAFLLKNRPDVRTFLQRSYSTLFVDEFQDTDPLQAEILFLLAADDPRETVWQKAVPRPGSLFIVGDAKQSIYRFRRADVQVFELSRQKLEETGAATARLQTSFRTLGALIDWINPAFQALFPEVATAAQSSYDGLLKIRDQGPDDLSVRKIDVRNTGNNSYVAAEQDAGRIASFIAAAIEGRSEFNGPRDNSLLGEQASPGDFMLLTRNTTRLHIYARALEKRGIPFDLVGGGRLGMSRELHSLVQLMEVVRDPSNAVATLSYLRGPLVGLDDNELIEMRAAGLRFNYRTDQPELLPDPLAKRLADAYTTLVMARRELFHRTPAAAFDRLLMDTGLLEFAASDEGGSASSRAGSLVRAAAFVKHWESRGKNWIEILQELRTLIEDTTSKVQEMTLEAGQRDVVQVMNLHQAKGLEAPVVFLADPMDRGGIGKEPEFHVLRDDESGDSVVIPAGRERQFSSEPIAVPAGWELHKAAEQDMLAAEEMRLLYVAATRAKNLLVVSRHHSRDIGPWRHIRDALDHVPELESPPEVEPEPLPQMPGGMEDALNLVRLRWNVSQKPSYAVRPVTGSDEVDVLHLEGTGRGREYGSGVHRLLEEVIAGRLESNVRQYCAALFGELGVESELVEKAVAAIDGFRRSEIWTQVESATRKFTEVAVAIPDQEDDLQTITSGRIDLIYETQNGWQIVDFKTDEAVTEADVEAVTRRYQDQVRAYARYWARATGERVAGVSLWLTSINRRVMIPED